MEHSGSLVECLTRDRGAAGLSSPASLPCVLAQDTLILALYWFNPGRYRPYITERLLMGCKESNQTKQRKIEAYLLALVCIV